MSPQNIRQKKEKNSADEYLYDEVTERIITHIPAQDSAELYHAVKDNNVILDTIVGWVMYVILLFAIYLYWTGHNAPGGGFIAGLMTAAVVVLLYVTFGSNIMYKALRFDFKYVMAAGLILAVGCAIGGAVFSYPVLTHTFGHWQLPFFGEVELATAAIFDLGVYFVVTGGCITIITAIGEYGYHKEEGEKQDER
jgi:multisubunit Na+/H+ antiporter MnhB subunit